MKKIIFVLAFITIFSMYRAEAMFSSSYSYPRVGIIGGVTTSSAKISDINTESIVMYHYGLTAQFPLAFGFAVQPSVLCNIKGVKLKDLESDLNVKEEAIRRISYLELPVQLQWGFNAERFRPYIFAEPFLSIKLKQDFKGYEHFRNTLETISREKWRWDYGLSLGGGIELGCLQLSAKYYWNLGNVSKDGKESAKAKYVDAVYGRIPVNGTSVSLAIMF